MSSKTKTKQLRFSLPTGYIGLVLTILLLTLKLTGVINPSWLLVFLPLIVGVGIPVLFVLVATIIIGTIAGFTVFLALASGKK